MRARLRIFLTALVFLIVAVGVFIGITRGGQDFRVFHYAGRLVLEHRWDALYNEGPDRYLYAPGFALLIAPFAALPENLALGVGSSRPSSRSDSRCVPSRCASAGRRSSSRSSSPYGRC